jgi:hypothetical protein
VPSTFRPVAAFMIAVVIAAALGSAIQTQFNLAFIARLGIEVPLSIRLETTAADLFGFGFRQFGYPQAAVPNPCQIAFRHLQWGARSTVQARPA